MVISDPIEAAEALAELMRGKKTIAITGAGISTDSGLPDYRGQGTTEKPSIEYDMFVDDPVWQRWVWQRNHETWRVFNSLEPSPGHKAIARLEKAGLISGVATQNIDGLHTKAGTNNVWKLHGSFAHARCLACERVIPREEYATELDELNPGWPQYDRDPAVLATADREDAEASNFKVAPCSACGGLMKPAVVFFGEGLPGDVMDTAMSAATDADVALVVGSSLVVNTGMWITRQAWATGSPIAIVNYGPTAADGIVDLRIDAGASETLEALATMLDA